MTDHSKNSEVGEFILDSIVPDINVPIMKLSRKKPFNMEKWIDKTTAEISKKKSNKKVCK